MNKGKIYSTLLALPQNAVFTEDQYFSGIRRYAQVALVLGMDADFRGCHSRFLANYSESGINYGIVGEFELNKAGNNRAAEKITHMHNNPEHNLVASPGIGDIRYEWPGVIRLPHSTGAELILANSGVPDYMDVLLIAAFAIGVNEIDPSWSLENFDENNQYAWSLRQAARLILIADELNFDYHTIIDITGFDAWLDNKAPYARYTGILEDALENF